MNNTSKKIISIMLCASMITGTIGFGVCSASGLSAEAPAAYDTAAETVSGTAKKAEKDETVYVLAASDGTVKKVIVSDWLKNSAGDKNLADISALTNIENVKGNEAYTSDGKNSLVWTSDGNDIYYRGTTENELPVEISISYMLNGNAITPEALAGKSGKVTIRFDYTNNAFEMKEIGGRQEKIFVPFAMLTGMILDNEVFRNVEVTNGRLINDGSRTVVAGIALPGLQESLGIDKDILEIPEYIEVTADVTNFTMGMTATVATNEVFNNINTDKLDSENDLSSSLTELTDAMMQLKDGSSDLYDGLCTLLEKSDKLVKGINQLEDGSKALADGTKSVDSGASELQSGAAQLSSGLQKLVQNNEALNGGAKQVFDTLLDTANTQIQASGLSVPALTIDNYSDVLNKTIMSLDESSIYNQALAQVTEKVNAQRDYIRSQVESAVRQQVTAQVSAAVTQQMKDKGLTDEMLRSEEMQKQISALTEKNVNEQMGSDAVKSTIDNQTELQVQKAISDNMASEEVQGRLAAASAGAQSLISLKSQLDSYNSFYLGLLSYTSGVTEASGGAQALKNGADSLKSGTSQLAAGSDQLYSGIRTLQDSTPALIDGITKLRDGSLLLSDGLKEFDEQGISKLVNAVDGDLAGLTERIEAVKSVSLNYKAFSGISENMDGQVKFFFRTDSIN